MITDENAAYPSIGSDFASHESVNHSKGEYVRGDAYTNTVESHFALFKRGVYGAFHHLSEEYLPRHLVEFDFRANTRRLTDLERAAALLLGAKGKRLMQRQPCEVVES